MTNHVWYAAYGSNCDDDRFGCYLAGGRPVGSTKNHVGCRDTTPPTGTTPVLLPHAIYFGGWSPYWRSAVAYLDPARTSDSTTLAIARRITVDQFSDIVAQESGGTTLATPIPIRDVAVAGTIDVGGVYGTVVHTGHVNGEPVVTCTAATHRGPGRPSAAYLDTIRRGLARFHHDATIADYLDRLAIAAEAAAPPNPHRHDNPLDDVDRWADLFLDDEWDWDDLDHMVLDGDRMDDRAAINAWLTS